jgi:hypothetical protein
MGKGEISWKGKFEDGRKRQVYAKRIGREWTFYEREGRFDPWDVVENPPLDDWMDLLNGVERRIPRRLISETELPKLQQIIKEKHPEAEL